MADFSNDAGKTCFREGDVMSKTLVKKIRPMEPAEPSSRRKFVKVALSGAGLCYFAGIGYPVYRYLASPVEKAAATSAVTEVTLADAHKLPLGSALMFKFGSRPSLLIHHEDDSWVALSAICSHLGCTVQYQPGQRRIFCACHGGVYDAKSGQNISGPPPKPLSSFKVALTGTGVLVSRS